MLYFRRWSTCTYIAACMGANWSICSCMCISALYSTLIYVCACMIGQCFAIHRCIFDCVCISIHMYALSSLARVCVCLHRCITGVYRHFALVCAHMLLHFTLIRTCVPPRIQCRVQGSTRKLHRWKTLKPGPSMIEFFGSPLPAQEWSKRTVAETSTKMGSIIWSTGTVFYSHLWIN